MANAKIKGDNVKEITFDVKDLNLDERIEFNRVITNDGKVTQINFKGFVNAVRVGTTLTD